MFLNRTFCASAVLAFAFAASPAMALIVDGGTLDNASNSAIGPAGSLYATNIIYFTVSETSPGPAGEADFSLSANINVLATNKTDASDFYIELFEGAPGHGVEVGAKDYFMKVGTNTWITAIPDTTVETGQEYYVESFGVYSGSGPNFSSKNKMSELFTYTTTPVPEASSWAMMAIGFAGLGFAGFARSHRKRRAFAV